MFHQDKLIVFLTSSTIKIFALSQLFLVQINSFYLKNNGRSKFNHFQCFHNLFDSNKIYTIKFKKTIKKAANQYIFLRLIYNRSFNIKRFLVVSSHTSIKLYMHINFQQNDLDYQILPTYGIWKTKITNKYWNYFNKSNAIHKINHKQYHLWQIPLFLSIFW